MPSPPAQSFETVAALGRIADSGLFEDLATAVLRAADPSAYSRLVHVGTTATGKPAPEPVDGIGPGASGGLVVANHTTTARGRLRTKWLGAKDGDVTKALRECAVARQAAPTLRCTLVLTTNQDPSAALVRDVTTAANSANVGIDIWNVKRIARFLDDNSAGQELRARYLGIPATLLTVDRLRRFSDESLSNLEGVTLDRPQAWVSTATDDELRELLSVNSLVFLSMPSGMGKTVAGARLLRGHCEAGHFGAWVSATVFEGAHSPLQALEHLLHASAPGLGVQDAAAQALSLVSDSSTFLLVVDDISHCTRPQEGLRNLLAWSKSAPRQLQVVCPVQPSLLRQAFNEKYNALAGHIVEGTFAPEDAKRAVHRRLETADGTPASMLQAKELAEALGNDPLLIGLAFSGSSGAPDARQVIPAFVRSCIERASDELGAGERQSDMWESLMLLCRKMLEHRDLAPLWSTARAWLGSRPVATNHIGALLRQRRLMVVRDEAGMEERIGFRHDRVRDWLLASAMRTIRARGDDSDVLGDPFYSEVLALSLWLCEVAGSPVEMESLSPLTATHLLKHLVPSSPLRQQLLARLQAWWASPDALERCNHHLRLHAQWALIDLDGDDVKELCRQLHLNRVVGQALLRNGDALGGAAFCGAYDPTMTAPFRDEIIEHATRLHGCELRADLSARLADESVNSKQLRTGLLYLAGHVASTDLSPAIARAWATWGRDLDFLHAFIWATCRCFDDSLTDGLREMIGAWAEARTASASREPDGQLRDPVLDHSLQHAWNGGMADRALEILTAAATTSDMRWAISVLLDRVDMPRAQEFIARFRADAEEEAARQGQGYPYWLSSIDLQMLHRHAPARSSNTTDRLVTLWRDSPPGSTLRRQSMELLLPRLRASDLPFLQSVPVDEGNMSDSVLRRRLELKDRSAIPLFVTRVRKPNGWYWWQHIRGWTCPELTEELELEMGRRREFRARHGTEDKYPADWVLTEILQELPRVDAERILAAHWDHLKEETEYVSTALFVESAGSRALASSVVNASSNPSAFFEHLTMRWRIGGTDNRGRLTETRLRALEPYLHLLSEDVHMLWNACNIDGHFAWRRRHLDAQVVSSDWHASRLLSAEGIKGMLFDLEQDDTRGSWVWSHWLEEIEEMGNSVEAAFIVLESWLRQRGTLKALEIAATCVIEKGARHHLSILDVAGAPIGEAADAIREDARFGVRRRVLS